MVISKAVWAYQRANKTGNPQFRFRIVWNETYPKSDSSVGAPIWRSWKTRCPSWVWIGIAPTIIYHAGGTPLTKDQTSPSEKGHLRMVKDFALQNEHVQSSTASIGYCHMGPTRNQGRTTILIPFCHIQFPKSGPITLQTMITSHKSIISQQYFWYLTISFSPGIPCNLYHPSPAKSRAFSTTSVSSSTTGLGSTTFFSSMGSWTKSSGWDTLSSIFSGGNMDTPRFEQLRIPVASQKAEIHSRSGDGTWLEAPKIPQNLVMLSIDHPILIHFGLLTHLFFRKKDQRWDFEWIMADFLPKGIQFFEWPKIAHGCWFLWEK